MPVIVGTWPLSGDFGPVPLAQVASTLHACLDHGLLAFDTAPNYGCGFAEHALGVELAHHPDVAVLTKCGNHPFAGKSFAPDDLRRSLEQSLRRLRRDCVDTLFLHNPRDEIRDWEPVLALLDALVAEGKILHRGLSAAKGHDYPPELLARFDVVQDDANLLYQDALHRAAQRSARFLARSPLATGVLGGHITADTVFEPGDHRAGWLRGERLRSLCARVDALREVAGDEPLPRLASRFLLSHPAVDDVVFGVKRPEHVRRLAEARDAEPLAAHTRAELEALWRADFGLEGERALGF